MKYRIAYIMIELISDEFGKLDSRLCSDFIPLEPPLIFDDKTQALDEVKVLKSQEVINSLLSNSFNASGDKIKNYCYDEIEE